jgi:hypothetical protein
MTALSRLGRDCMLIVMLAIILGDSAVITFSSLCARPLGAFEIRAATIGGERSIGNISVRSELIIESMIRITKDMLIMKMNSPQEAPMMVDQSRFFDSSHLSARGSFLGKNALWKKDGATNQARLFTSHRKVAS